MGSDLIIRYTARVFPSLIYVRIECIELRCVKIQISSGSLVSNLFFQLKNDENEIDRRRARSRCVSFISKVFFFAWDEVIPTDLRVIFMKKLILGVMIFFSWKSYVEI